MVPSPPPEESLLLLGIDEKNSATFSSSLGRLLFMSILAVELLLETAFIIVGDALMFFAAVI